MRIGGRRTLRGIMVAGAAVAMTVAPAVAAEPGQSVEMRLRDLGTVGQMRGLPVTLSWTGIDAPLHLYPTMDNQTIGGVVEVAPDDPTSEDLVISNRRTWQWIAIPDDAPGAGVRSPIVWTRYLPESRLIASGTWSTKTHPGAVDGAFAVTATPGATMRFTFEGDQAGLVVDTAYRSVLAVWIDGVRQENVIVPRRPGGARTLVVLPRASAEGQHRVRVTLLRGRLRLDGAGWLAPRTAHRPDKGCWNYYPSICVQETPTVLCDDIAERDFVIWFHLDPHGFDPDRDGIGCEA